MRDERGGRRRASGWKRGARGGRKKKKQQEEGRERGRNRKARIEYADRGRFHGYSPVVIVLLGPEDPRNEEARTLVVLQDEDCNLHKRQRKDRRRKAWKGGEGGPHLETNPSNKRECKGVVGLGVEEVVGAGKGIEGNEEPRAGNTDDVPEVKREEVFGDHDGWNERSEAPKSCISEAPALPCISASAEGSKRSTYLLSFQLPNLINQNYSCEKTAVESRVEHGKLSPHAIPSFLEAMRSTSFPDDKQVSHFEDGENHEFEECSRRKGVEKSLHHNAGRQVHKAQIRVHDRLRSAHRESHGRTTTISAPAALSSARRP
eukprot:768814-Hanusia_phi.AAC.13